MLKALREKRAKLVADMRAILTGAENDNGRDLTAEEIAAYDALEAELEKLKPQINRAERLEQEEASLSSIRPAAARQNGIIRPPGPEAAREFESFGQFMHAVRFNPNDQRLNFVESAGANADDLSAEMRMDSNAQGGFMVPTQLRPALLSVPAQDALVRPRASVIEAGDPPDAGVTFPALDQTGNNPGNMFGGVEVKWIGEGDEKPETNANLREITLTPHEVAGFTTITDKLLRNWRASSAFIEKLLRDAVAGGEDYAFLRGNGITQPLGALNSGATYFVNRAVANQVSPKKPARFQRR